MGALLASLRSPLVVQVDVDISACPACRHQAAENAPGSPPPAGSQAGEAPGSLPPSGRQAAASNEGEPTLWRAPASGTRWHTRYNCHGLREARQIIKVSAAEAAAHGLTPCRLSGHRR